MSHRAEISALRGGAVPLSGGPTDFDALLERIGDKRVVLLGEASHGTHEFYRVRAAITKRLVAEKGFHAVAVEADWPDSARVHRFVTGRQEDDNAVDALGGFRRFPTWMWRNADVVDFLGWLRAHNDARTLGERVGFHGLDLYSLYASIEAVLAYLDRFDPEAARRARARYACLDPFRGDTEAYGTRVGLGLEASCEEAVTSELVEMRDRADGHDKALGADDEATFSAQQNARVAKSAEEYYRSLIGGRVSTWNLRDRHMADTLDALAELIGRRAQRPKIVVWAHNSHLGDARATDMNLAGELNVGQLVRERYGAESYAVGFSTFDGTVTAARDWGSPGERRVVRAALSGSWESLLHEVARSAQTPFLLFADSTEAGPVLLESRLFRSIGVVYRPESERRSHYFRSRLGDQFDAVLHFDRTRAVEPLERSSAWLTGEPPETYPFAI